jgi:hypothetical protein
VNHTLIRLEAYSQVNETAKISGVALIPRISRNNNLYTKAELERFDNVTVPLNWEHDPDKKIGSVTFHYNPAIETVYYEGEITNEAAANTARNKTLFTSIEATPQEMREICNGGSDCFSMPFGLKPEGLALTETPGVPETSVRVIENYIKECSGHEHEKGTQYVASSKANEVNTHGEFTKKLEKIMNYLNLTECNECGELHSKEDVNMSGDMSRADISKKKKKVLASKKN